MPKVKFSTLVSGMSGKSNGSVFSTNRAGAYFRNNTSKVKPITGANGIRKSLFTTAVQAWRQLTIEQQIAWNTAVDQFTRVNVFGDSFIPSGYNLFTQINNCRLAAGDSILLLPPTARSIPDPGELEFVIPECFQFMPIQTVFNYNKLIPGVKHYFTLPDSLTGLSLFVDRYLGARFDFSTSVQSSDFITNSVSLFEIPTDSGGPFGVGLQYAAGVWSIVGGWTNGSGVTFAFTGALTVDPRKAPIHVGFKTAPVAYNQTKVWVNGQPVNLTFTTVGSFTNAEIDGSLFFGSTTLANMGYFSLSDFRWVEDTVTDEQAKLIAYGYVLGIERTINGMNHWINGDGSVAEVGPTYGKIETPDLSTTVLTVTPYDSHLIPFLNINIPNNGLEGLELQVYTSNNISNGRLANQTKRRIVKRVPWEESQTFSIDDVWQSIWGNWVAGANIDCTVFIYDTTTGVVLNTAIKPKKPRRFKAGAELSGAVN